jgi:leader peptidase (prepilin peptidase)/N-methyltransferase
MGDVKLLGAMGVFLGPYVLLSLFFGSLLGAFYGVVAVRAKGLSLRSKVPFGPFLAVGGVLVAAVGPALWEWYVALL